MNVREHDATSARGAARNGHGRRHIVGRRRFRRGILGGEGTSRRSALGGWIVLLAVAAAIATPFVLSAQARAASPAPGQTTGNDVAAGAALFQQSCATCHGVRGAGVNNADGSVRGPNIQNAGAAAADFVLRTGRMPLSDPNQPMTRAQPAFDADQIRQLTAYVASLGSGPAIPAVDVTGADLSHGRALFTANCAACHAPTGAGDAVGGGFNAPSLRNAEPVDVAEAMRIGPPPMPVFDPKSFSQQDVNDIAAYVAYLRTAPSPGGLAIGEIGPVPEGFVAFVVGLTAVLVISRFVGRRGRTPQRTSLDEDVPE